METKAVNTTAELEKELGMSEQELFSFVEYHAEDAERIGYSEYSYWKSVFRNFLKNKAAVVMIIVFFAIFIFSFVALWIGKYDYQHLIPICASKAPIVNIGSVPITLAATTGARFGTPRRLP